MSMKQTECSHVKAEYFTFFLTTTLVLRDIMILETGNGREVGDLCDKKPAADKFRYGQALSKLRSNIFTLIF